MHNSTFPRANPRAAIRARKRTIVYLRAETLRAKKIGALSDPKHILISRDRALACYRYSIWLIMRIINMQIIRASETWAWSQIRHASINTHTWPVNCDLWLDLDQRWRMRKIMMRKTDEVKKAGDWLVSHAPVCRLALITNKWLETDGRRQRRAR